MPVSDKEQQQINTLVARFETGTGVEAVAAIVRKADAYPEIPWKAYAIGSALGASAIVLPIGPLAHWSATAPLILHALSVLGAGAALAALAVFAPAAGRLFLDRLRAQAEVRQYAQAMFLERELFSTADRRALLVFVSRFERTAVIVADKGLAQCLPAPELDRIASAMQPVLAHQGVTAAFEFAFDALSALLRTRDAGPSARANALDDAVVVERGL